MANFRSEWWRLLVKPWQMVGGLAAMLKFFGSAAFAGILTAMAGAFGSVPWWTLPFVAVASFYLSWTAGMAWERSGKPSVTVGTLTCDERFTVFFVHVENSSPFPIRPSVTITRIADARGNRLGSPPWMCHWRDKPPNFTMELEEGVGAEAGLLGVRHYSASNNPALCIFDQAHQLRGVTNDVPLSEQETVVVHMVVNCATPTGERGKPVRRTFTVAPDPGSQAGYRVVTEELPAQRARWKIGSLALQEIVDRVCKAIERIFGNRQVHPGRARGRITGPSSGSSPNDGSKRSS